jgi:hypothetical protein
LRHSIHYASIEEKKDKNEILSRSDCTGLYMTNPSNPLAGIVNVKESCWNRYRVWKTLSLMVLAGLTPPEWEISIVDENLGALDYSVMPRPNLEGNFSYRNNLRLNRKAYADLKSYCPLYSKN